MSNARFSILQAKAVTDIRISNSQFRTLAVLGTYGDREGWCWPSLSTIADQLGKSRQAVSKDIHALKELGYVQITSRQRENGSNTSNLYRLIFDFPEGGCQPDDDTLSTSEVDTLTTHINVLNNAQEKNLRGVDSNSIPITEEEPLLQPNSSAAKVGEMSQDFTGLAGSLSGVDAVRQKVKSAPRRTPDQLRANIQESITRYAQRREGGAPDLTGIPEDLYPYAEVFVSLFGRSPTKQERGYWIREWRNQKEMGLDPVDIQQGYAANVRSNLTIKSPASITTKAWEYHSAKDQTVSEPTIVMEVAPGVMMEVSRPPGAANWNLDR